MIRDPRFANGISLVLLALLCVRMEVLTVADVATIILTVLGLLSNRLTHDHGSAEDQKSRAPLACPLSGCPHVSSTKNAPPTDGRSSGGPPGA